MYFHRQRKLTDDHVHVLEVSSRSFYLNGLIGNQRPTSVNCYRKQVLTWCYLFTCIHLQTLWQLDINLRKNVWFYHTVESKRNDFFYDLRHKGFGTL